MIKEATLSITENQWLAELGKYNQAIADVVPPDWITLKRLAELKNLSTNQVGSILRNMGNKIERRKFRISAGERGLYPVMHYKIKK